MSDKREFGVVVRIVQLSFDLSLRVRPSVPETGKGKQLAVVSPRSSTAVVLFRLFFPVYRDEYLGTESRLKAAWAKVRVQVQTTQSLKNLRFFL